MVNSSEKRILAIDPGNKESAYVLMDSNLKPIEFGKVENEKLLDIVGINTNSDLYAEMAIEMIASYGMAVGKEVFDTCTWIGRFEERAFIVGGKSTRIYRKEEKMNLCGSMKAKDSNIIQALKDRFGDKGTKANKGWFYGFSKDVWQAYAVGVTYYDLYLKDKRNQKVEVVING